MSNIMQDLHTVGLNPFAVTLLAESLLKSPLAPLTVGKPQGVFFPIQRSDCPGWVGVRITLEAVPKDAALAAAPQAVPFDRTTALVLLQAASKSGDPGAISLAAQLAGAAPCKDCGYVNFKCRCAHGITAKEAGNG